LSTAVSWIAGNDGPFPIVDRRLGVSAGFILLYLSPLSLIVLVGAWPLWYLILRHRYRASAATALAAPAALWITGDPTPLVALGLAMGVVISVRHIPSLK